MLWEHWNQRNLFWFAMWIIVSNVNKVYNTPALLNIPGYWLNQDYIKLYKVVIHLNYKSNDSAINKHFSL